MGKTRWNMKKLLAFFLILFLALSVCAFAACDNSGASDDGSSPGGEDEPSLPEEPEVPDYPEKPEGYLFYEPVEGYDYTEGDEIVKIEYYSTVAGAYKHANVILPPDYDD